MHVLLRAVAFSNEFVRGRLLHLIRYILQY
ncbi:hypothetical protein P879_12042 [Paragonimus westermani]|uniref:Uncharacterized protein n=1 Tax=Paragonimus westermani TaxID=34504 RepID=A0A8T0D482_9TREM|nr:hypothetical protein P879_12042 [Paragonimus westermani]